MLPRPADRPIPPGDFNVGLEEQGGRIIVATSPTPSGGATKPSLLLRTAMNWKPNAARLGLAFALAMMMNPLPTAIGRTASAIVGRPSEHDFSIKAALPQLRIRDIM